MRNFKIVLQYEGTRYKGWQKQGKGEGDSSSSASPENTIQGKLERLLSRIAGKPVEIQGSGRTDAGVHAYGQVANFHMDTDDTPEALMEKINSYLPEDIGVISVEEVPERFHSRLNAKSKTYRYRVLNSAVPHIFERRYVYQVPEHLDMEAMRRAALLLTGSHDFKAFTSAKKGKNQRCVPLIPFRSTVWGTKYISPSAEMVFYIIWYASLWVRSWKWEPGQKSRRI